MGVRLSYIWAAIAVACVVALGIPAGASASSNQISIFQDDGVILGEQESHDPDEAMAEAKVLGADVLRTTITWNRVAPDSKSRTMPAGFHPSDPNSAGYNWSQYDNIVERARAHGLKILFDLSPAIPYWASDEPSRCPHHIGGYSQLGLSCMWKPNVNQFAAFAAAVAKRYGPASSRFGGQTAYYSIWNEPNLEHYLYPQIQRYGKLRLDYAAHRYRELFMAGWRSISKYDPERRGDVLFGETAAISSPIDTIYGALCLDPNGKPWKGLRRKLQGCSKPIQLPIGGIAIHPYNNHAGGSVFTRSFTTDSLPLAYVGRLHKVLATAEKAKRIPRRRGIFVTEFGFQSSPPETRFGLSLSGQAQAINESERLFWGDSRVSSFAQFELFDPAALVHENGGADTYTTGLRFIDGRVKPSWSAFQMPLVVTKRSANSVEIWGDVRPAEGPTTVQIESFTAGASPAPLMTTQTNASGYFRINLNRPGAARLLFRTTWTDPSGQLLTSRTAIAGKKIQYRVDPPPKKKKKKKAAK